MKLNDFFLSIAECLEINDLNLIKADFNISKTWDSLGQINIINMLDKNYNLVISIDHLNEITYVQDIIDIIEEKKNIKFEN
tara:strand:+ start:911 stop:1153 length:243 start_codon:yes stop_codon:yes gene_type:complete